MPISKGLKTSLFLAGVASLMAAVGCGGSGVVIPHPTGNYSNASFKGSYVYEIHGILSDDTPYREAGVITADGNGNITNGIDGFANPNNGGAIQSSASVTGTYTIASDGTGQILLGSTGLGTLVGASQISLAVTLASVSQAKLMEADAFASGGGTAELQTATDISSAPNGTFVFRIHQEVDPQNSASASQVGFFTITGGSLSSGSMDQNLFPIGASSLTLTAGSFSAPSSLGSGTGSFSDSSPYTTNFFYYIVNSSKFVVLASNPGAVGSGSAELQTGAVGTGLQGTYAFGSSGDDFQFNISSQVATVGEFTGTGASISAGNLDALQDGTNYSQDVAFTGAATTGTNNPSAQGRVLVTLNESGTSVPVIFWMVSPTRMFFLDNLTTRAEDGTADLQTSTSFSGATFKGQFALLMNGIDTTPEGLARIGTLQFDGSSKLTLVELANASQSGTGASNPGAMAGTYQVGTGGRFTGTVSSGGNGLDLVGYGVSGSQAYMLQVDPGTNTSGTIQLQQ
ncbi:MAG TPA: hypothetical protein VHQ22_01630 [Terriglobales bacterium]|nr:hypothetical protein [Terriglobales bacterium]